MATEARKLDQAASYSKRYHCKPGFKEAEAKRKAEWYQNNKMMRADALRRWRIRTGVTKSSRA